MKRGAYIQILGIVVLIYAYVNSSLVVGLIALTGLLIWPLLWDNWVESALKEQDDSHVHPAEMTYTQGVIHAAQLYSEGWALMPQGHDPEHPKLWYVGKWVNHPSDPKAKRVFLKVGILKPDGSYKDLTLIEQEHPNLGTGNAQTIRK